MFLVVIIKIITFKKASLAIKSRYLIIAKLFLLIAIRK